MRIRFAPEWLHAIPDSFSGCQVLDAIPQAFDSHTHIALFLDDQQSCLLALASRSDRFAKKVQQRWGNVVAYAKHKFDWQNGLFARHFAAVTGPHQHDVPEHCGNA